MFGEYSIEVRVVWNPQGGCYVQSYAVFGVDGPFDADNLLRMATLRPRYADTVSEAVALADGDLEAAMAETRLINGVQPRLL